MKSENYTMNNNENTKCRQIELLADDYLEGMIAAEDRQKMEQHLAECQSCRKYLEETVFLLEKAVLLSKAEKATNQKQSEIWNKIQDRINKPSETSDTTIYNMSGLEDEDIPSRDTGKSRDGKTGAWGSIRYYMSGIAAVVVLAFIIYGVNQFTKRSGSENNYISGSVIEIGGPKWMVTPIKGSPLINNMVMKAIDSLAIGGEITTNDSSKAELYVAGLGSIIIEPGSKVRLVKSVEGEHRIALDYGSIDASILAKPRTFFVDAGSVTAVDLGCSYKFSVDQGGDGLLYVRQGRVALESAGRQSIVPEGKFCVTKKDIGPGTPFREDSSPQLKKALMEFDFGNCGGQCVNVILKNAKKTDAVTLVNILPRVDEQYKTVVYQKVADYCPPPKSLSSRDSIPHHVYIENLNEWVDKIMDQVHENIQQNIERVEKQIEEQMKQFDSDKWQKQWQENWNKNASKWKYYYNGKDTIILHNGQTWVTPDTPSMEELEDLNLELQELHNDLKIDNEEFKKEMEKVREEMQKVNEEIRKEMEKSRKETEKEIEREKRDIEKEKRDIEKEKKEIEKEKKDREKEQRENRDNDNDD